MYHPNMNERKNTDQFRYTVEDQLVNTPRLGGNGYVVGCFERNGERTVRLWATIDNTVGHSTSRQLYLVRVGDRLGVTCTSSCSLFQTTHFDDVNSPINNCVIFDRIYLTIDLFYNSLSLNRFTKYYVVLNFITYQ